jgi:hypothetical protein
VALSVVLRPIRLLLTRGLQRARRLRLQTHYRKDLLYTDDLIYRNRISFAQTWSKIIIFQKVATVLQVFSHRCSTHTDIYVYIQKADFTATHVTHSVLYIVVSLCLPLPTQNSPQKSCSDNPHPQTKQLKVQKTRISPSLLTDPRLSY